MKRIFDTQLIGPFAAMVIVAVSWRLPLNGFSTRAICQTYLYR